MKQMKRAADMLRRRLGHVQPSAAIILGSGCGIEMDRIRWQVSGGDIPGFRIPTVEGHAGRLISGTFRDHEILLMRGRVHYYEGSSTRSVTFQVRLAHSLGIRNMILVSAAGGIGKTLSPGSIMLVENHICGQPMYATLRTGAVYNVAWRKYVMAACTGIPVRTGIYVWNLGPSYETPAEIVAFERRGADAVGMSLVPEALEAAALNMNVLAVVVITNAAAGLEDQKLDHESVLDAAGAAQENLTNVITHALNHSP